MTMSSSLLLGLMTGTSLDAIDVALLESSPGHIPKVLEYLEAPYPETSRSAVSRTLGGLPGASLTDLMRLHKLLALDFAEAVNSSLERWRIRPAQVSALGCHGQTVWHQPDGQPGFTVQLGCGATLAAETGITTVVDFRSGDIAMGGQGAPLAPAFHAALLQPTQRAGAFLNLGGIANLTVIPEGATASAIIGFDVGPANTLLDLWVERHRGTRCDDGGEFARSGRPHRNLLSALLQDVYFTTPPPKSSGREYFNMKWLEGYMGGFPRIAPADVQSTLVELTAQAIADAVQAYTEQDTELFICGGGAHNAYLMQRIEALADRTVKATERLGCPGDAVEAAAFAWLAGERLAGRPSNLPSVTGAKGRVSLGAVYQPPLSMNFGDVG